MEEDRELQAMSQVNAALKDLSEEELYRVMQWAANKYLQNTAPLKLAGPTAVAPPAGVIVASANTVDDADTVEGEAKDNEEVRVYATFAEMLDASGANKDTERFLIAAYWLQVTKAQPSWKSFEINKLLKDTGNQVENIGNPLRSLSKTKPAQVIQVSKNTTSTGKGSKTLKLTTEGVKKAEQMLNRGQ